MIASLHGVIESLGSDRAVINVSGVGYLVLMPTSTLSLLGNVSDEVTVQTHLHVREDNLTLYGFGTPEELWFFQTAIGVSGLGPKTALAMLSAMKVDQLTMAIASGNTDLLTEVPGIGKKIANRLVLELKDKIAAGPVGVPSAQFTQDNNEVLAALTSLGYSVAEAARAVAALPQSDKLTLEEKIKLALQYFGAG
ncbi:MAG: Holliday junction branch migration protein RuvA [Chloroflexi bacterium]|nr:Holliday junction branch migration protein RuvA [Chloroflexota bacterium]